MKIFADGETNSEGENFAGCDSSELPSNFAPPDVCGLPKEQGEGRNYTIRWFFDMEYGGCSR